MLERRQAWPAVAIMGIAILSLAVSLKSGQTDMPLTRLWLMGVIAGLYLLLGLALGGLTWRAPLLLATMAAAHLFMALLMGWGYCAVEGRARIVYEALQHGLWDYLPGTALQIGFAGIFGAVLADLLQPGAALEEEPEEPQPALPPLPDLSAAPSQQSAVDLAGSTDGVAGALLARGVVVAAGAWQRDPEAALHRVKALSTKAGSGLSSFHFDRASLLVRSEGDGTVALLLREGVGNEWAHDLLKALWAAGERLPFDAPLPR